ncbi:hypothetical protein P421_09970 [Heyndrickxia coagulans P38]|nr:hypothetical protein P421_09970 [Heyndrickxia coagulans P38]
MRAYSKKTADPSALFRAAHSPILQMALPKSTGCFIRKICAGFCRPARLRFKGKKKLPSRQF